MTKALLIDAITIKVAEMSHWSVAVSSMDSIRNSSIKGNDRQREPSALHFDIEMKKKPKDQPIRMRIDPEINQDPNEMTWW